MASCVFTSLRLVRGCPACVDSSQRVVRMRSRLCKSMEPSKADGKRLGVYCAANRSAKAVMIRRRMFEPQLGNSWRIGNSGGQTREGDAPAEPGSSQRRVFSISLGGTAGSAGASPRRPPVLFPKIKTSTLVAGPKTPPFFITRNALQIKHFREGDAPAEPATSPAFRLRKFNARCPNPQP